MKIKEDKIIKFFCFVYIRVLNKETSEYINDNEIEFGNKTGSYFCRKLFWRFYFCEKD